MDVDTPAILASLLENFFIHIESEEGRFWMRGFDEARERAGSAAEIENPLARTNVGSVNQFRLEVTVVHGEFKNGVVVGG